MDSWPFAARLATAGAVVLFGLFSLKVFLLPAAELLGSFPPRFEEQQGWNSKLNDSLLSLSDTISTEKNILANIGERLAAIEEQTGGRVASMEKLMTEVADMQAFNLTEWDHQMDDVIKLKEALKEMGSLLNETNSSVQALQNRIDKDEENQEKRLEELESQVMDLVEKEKGDEDIFQGNLDKNCLEKGKGDLPKNVQEWENRACAKHSPTSFVQFSAYRRSRRSFVIVGLHNRTKPLNRTGTCQWTGNSGDVLQGTVIVFTGADDHGFENDAVVVRCKLRHVTRACGGYLTIRLANDNVVVYREDKSQAVDFPKTFLHNVSICVAPLFRRLSPDVVREWLDYHRVMLGVRNFILYDFALVNRPQLETELADYISSGCVTITDFQCVLQYPAWYYNQLVSVQDCIFRSQRVSKWVAVADFDEFVEVMPPNALSEVLEEYEDVPWIRHTVVDWNASICLPQDGLPFLQRAVYHKPETRSGHQKYFANPRKVQYAAIHGVLSPSVGLTLGKAVLKHNHFRNLQTGEAVCVDSSDPKDADYMEDGHISFLSQLVRNCSMDYDAELSRSQRHPSECNYYSKVWPTAQT